MKRSDLELWLELSRYGKPRSEKYFAHWVKSALSGPELLKNNPTKLRTKAGDTILRDYKTCLQAIITAVREDDSAFLRTLADSLDALKANDALPKRDPTNLLSHAYVAC